MSPGYSVLLDAEQCSVYCFLELSGKHFSNFGMRGCFVDFVFVCLFFCFTRASFHFVTKAGPKPAVPLRLPSNAWLPVFEPWVLELQVCLATPTTFVEFYFTNFSPHCLSPMMQNHGHKVGRGNPHVLTYLCLSPRQAASWTSMCRCLFKTQLPHNTGHKALGEGRMNG